MAPFQGVANVQFFDNLGNLLTNGVLYSYQAGTSTQQATYTDSTGTIQNTNPITFGPGARSSIWLTIGSYYKFVLCARNDGAFCAAGDILFSVDQVPGGSNSGGSGGGTFTGVFISQTSGPSTSGALRLAAGDSVCWRNVAGTTNICLSKDSNDLLTWAGGSLKFPEINTICGAAAAGVDLFWADNSAHRFMMANNGGSCVQVVGSGVDINASDQVIQLHFGSSPIPLSSTAPTNNQILQDKSGTLTPVNPLEATIGWGISGGALNAGQTCSAGAGIVSQCVFTTFASAHLMVRLTGQVYQAANACSTNAVVGVRDITTGTNLYTATILAAGYFDSGALSVALVAGDEIGVGVLTESAGCTTNPGLIGLEMVYQ